MIKVTANAMRESGLCDRVREADFCGVADEEDSVFELLPEHESDSFFFSESSPSSDFLDELEQLSLLELDSDELVSDDPQPLPEFEAWLSSSVVS
jgi:hypothetical protein